MKTLIKPLFLALALSAVSASATFATTPDLPAGRSKTAVAYQTSVYTTVAGRVRVALNKETGNGVWLRLKNADNKVLFTYQLGKNETKYRIELNMDELPDGTYLLETSNGVDLKQQSVVIATQRLVQADPVVALSGR